MKILSSFTRPNIIPNLYDFLKSTKEILKNVVNQTLAPPMFHRRHTQVLNDIRVSTKCFLTNG